MGYWSRWFALRRRLILVVAFVLVLLLYLKLMPGTSILSNLNIRQTSDKSNSRKVSTVSWSYHPPTRPSNELVGISLTIAEDHLQNMEFPIRNHMNLTRKNVEDFVFVTASDAWFFLIDMDAISKVQQLFPNYIIYFYDLSDGKLASYATRISELCNVVYRQFDFSLYPAHVRKLRNYAWKPLLIHEMLRHHDGVFWFDASTRFHIGDLETVVHPATSNGGIMTFDNAGTSIFSTTHEAMYHYLPIVKPASVNASMRGANIVLVYRTQFIYENIVRWWVLCALVKDCIAPTTDIYCKFRGRDQYAKCHRYDQSALNILLANTFNYDDNAYFNQEVPDIRIQRSSYGYEQVSVCGNNTSLRTKISPAVYFEISYFSFYYIVLFIVFALYIAMHLYLKRLNKPKCANKY